MYVLITNAGRESWFRVGDLLPVTKVEDDMYFLDPECVPEEHRRTFNVVWATDGKLLYDAEEYKAVQEQLTTCRREVEQLKREREVLLQTIERYASEHKTVTLPREVAEAIDVLKKEGVGISTILWGAPRGSNNTRKWKVLFEYVAEDDNIFKLADALRYGYKIAEPSIRDEIQAIAEDFAGNREQLVDRLADLFETRLAQKREKIMNG